MEVSHNVGEDIEDLGFWLFNVKYMVNIIFIDYLELVEILNCCLGGYCDFASTSLLMILHKFYGS